MINNMLETPKQVIKSVFTFSFLKVVIIFLILVFIAWIGYMATQSEDIYGDSAKELRDFDRRYNEYVNIFKNDTYGGTTPQETLNLFIKALEANDPELATLYFMPDDNGSREKWHKVMVDTYKAGKFPEVVKRLKLAIPEKSGIIGDSFYAFSTRNSNREVTIFVDLIFNGKIWKIEGIY